MKATTEFSEIVMFGARGFSQQVLAGMNEGWRGRVRLRALVDELENGFIHPTLGVPVISPAERLRDFADVPVLMTAASPALRARVAAQLEAEGATLATANSAGQDRSDPSAVYGAGSLCEPYTRVGPNVRIGAGSLILADTVGHDVEIGEFCTLHFNATVLGHVKVGRGVVIAPRAVIGNGTRARMLTIGDGAIIGTGAVVLRNVPPGARMVGNPAMSVSDWKKLRRLINAQP